MPAASEPGPRGVHHELPVRFRPLGVRLVATALTLMLVLLVTVIWLQLPAPVRESFTLLQKLTLLVIALLIGAVFHALSRSRVDADDDGLTVVNGYRSHRYDWGQVLAVTMRSGNPWAVLDLSDGTSQAAMGIQASDGKRAQAQVRRLRALVDARAGTEPGA
ncbi:MAG: hypothetical protein AVDCRST_MAG36-1453 [uncultured Nocardioidaceae bacterium]|uniref:Low molecular weight protein antigen 6 PH domain-containing protein n=1 Tax=uncultured Nocardioidaceae bacterium TaxID=253824 RepID=A0A6J4LUH5_9ACTN|nr:MAG: hypothetical protein AVDCRST_MAG36-1453 [uncultured Nocardioidaceae bacterium]